ncbi:MAG: beta-ketoacyl-[acyl-carrier-protein] synthase family protein [Fuerstiella sp.]|nr:beta-ketoacyl-[acyl-carrier-protein] synthase family protein [Fuerstiella sp.]MCP4782157.1 beta-ketoacyl-[acyl-carrier-protein] synthase family protein [Fuerstiella sp.]MCP4856915.1 beta-ketoacyl-[acyl-carrier-protein] synthase family protein [Fuerstiella sp.]
MFTLSEQHGSDRDVLVTGIGMITPLGMDRESSWQRLLAGDPAARELTAADIDCFSQLENLLKRTPGGAPVDHSAVAVHALATANRFPTTVETSFAEHFSHDALNNLIVAAFGEAIEHANLDITELASQRTGFVVGTSKASLRAMESEWKRCFDDSVSSGEDRPHEWQTSFMPDAPLSALLNLSKATGPASCPVAACATGLVGVLQAAALIHSGQCDVCITGSADASLRPSVLAAFHRLGVTSKSAAPATACRPFNVDRDGFVVGEGAAVFVLESRRHAEQRHACSLGQIVSGGWLTDPTGITQIDASGATVAELLRRMLVNHSPAIDDHPDFISLHGTGTETNDLAEASGLRQYFGQHIPPAFATKGATGHLLGAAGSVEFGFTLLGLRDGIVPGTANLSELDPDCLVSMTERTDRQSPLKTALKLSLGFGGHVAGCLIRR